MSDKFFPFVIRIPIAIMFSMSWLLGNHLLPWTAFYSEALSAIVLWLVGIFIISRARNRLVLGLPDFAALFMATIPWLQFLMGDVHFFGTAWIHSIYLFGFGVSIAIGFWWEGENSGECLDFLFFAFVVASVISVLIQLAQWLVLQGKVVPLELGVFGDFIIGWGRGRYSANLAQPNQLATLLLLGICGVAWGFLRRGLNPIIAFAMVVFLLLGVALTESRAAWVNLLVLLLFFLIVLKEKSRLEFQAGLVVLVGVFALMVWCLPFINSWIFGDAPGVRGLNDPYRVIMWKMLLSAVLDAPPLGYGWGQVAEAWIDNVDYPALGGAFRHSHNLVLDILIYSGLWVGFLFMAAFAFVFWKILKNVGGAESTVPFAAVSIMMFHAMVEFPLHYAYFLLPFGLLIGVMCRVVGLVGFFPIKKPLVIFVMMLLGLGVVLTIHDALEAERTYYSIGYGKRNMPIPPGQFPELFVLNQFAERILIANASSDEIENPANVRRMRNLLMTLPNSEYVFYLARNYAANGQPKTAEYWLGVMCKIAPIEVTSLFYGEWRDLKEGRRNGYDAVDWVGCTDSSR